MGGRCRGASAGAGGECGPPLTLYPGHWPTRLLRKRGPHGDVQAGETNVNNDGNKMLLAYFQNKSVRLRVTPQVLAEEVASGRSLEELRFRQ